jgi:FHS family L-fucose permease-like MFS transporter
VDAVNRGNQQLPPGTGLKQLYKFAGALNMATRSTPPALPSQPNYTGPFITVTALYFIFGFITNLNMQMVPHLKSVFDLSWFQAALANFAFFTAYFVISAPASRLIEAIGYKRTMVVSLLVQVVGALLFVPAASLPNFWLFLAGIFIIGSGVAALQTAVNPYVAILGPDHSAPFRLTLAQTFNSIGVVIAPYLASKLILNHSQLLDAAALARKTVTERLAYQSGIASTVKVPYMIIAAALVILGLAVALANLPAVKATQEFRPAKEGDSLLTRSIWSYRHTVLAALGIFLYVGVEVGLAQYMIGYFGLPKLGAMTAAAAAAMTSYYWLGALIGRILGSAMLTRIKAGYLLGVFGVLASLCLVISLLSSGAVAVWSILLCGFFMSIMFPTIFALGVAGLGPMTSKGSRLITTAIVGGAIIPVLIGKVTDNFGFAIAGVIPLICYQFIAW